VDAIVAELRALLENPNYCTDAVDVRELEPSSACALARRLAGVLTECAS
jgi:hypothetical protein